MEQKYYTDERAVQILLSVLKANGIRKIIASPGTTNITFVGSVQQDLWFEVYSSVDERSAAYLACGLAEETGEAVVLTCTGATASRNYYSGLTEAYYRKLPILAVTSHQGVDRIGHLTAQNIDRRQLPNDIVNLSLEIPFVTNPREEFLATVNANKAVQELRHNGGGPVHINLYTHYSTNFTVKELPVARIIRRYEYNVELPAIPEGHVVITVGSHSKFTSSQVEAIDAFCATYDAIVLCDHSSGYYGKYRAQMALPYSQSAALFKSATMSNRLCIHIGEVTGDYTMGAHSQEVWRVSPDGEIRDKYEKLSAVFQVTEEYFFRHYAKEGSDKHAYIDIANDEYERLYDAIPELPFSNLWVAQQTSAKLPSPAVMHFGILNSLRSWNMFKLPAGITTASNVGGFGIDGGVSSLIGASFANSKMLYFGAFGDLAFFYDMNSLGNRHVGNNLRILLVNNGCGTEFKLRTHPCHAFGEEANAYMAAAGHFGNKSKELVRHYTEDLGFKYFSASNKEEFNAIINEFVSPAISYSMILEVFTDYTFEDEAYAMIRNIVVDQTAATKKALKEMGEKVLGKGTLSKLRKLIP